MSAIPIQELLYYINQARTNPKKFSDYIKQELDSFIDKKSLPLMPKCTYSTFEGKPCWREAYVYMKNFKPIHPLQLNEGLNFAAMDHALDMKNNDFFDHQSSNGMSFSQRIQRRCGSTNGYMAENLGTQFDIKGRNHALQTIIGLIIDDGVPNRGHRVNNFSQNYRYCGIYSVKKGDRIETCIKFHSENVKCINNSKEPLKGKLISKPKETKNTLVNDIQKKLPKLKLQSNKFDGEYKMSSRSPSITKPGQKYVKSKSTSTKSSTRNGKTTIITTVKIVYSDGTTSQQITQKTY